MSKTIGLVVGIVFLLVGILGYVANPIVGADGFFLTNTAHDWVHLLTGIVFILWSVMAPRSVGMGLKIFGVVYLLVAILGFFTAPSGTGLLLNTVAINSADNWLHVVLGVVVLLLGFAASKDRTMMPKTQATV